MTNAKTQLAAAYVRTAAQSLHKDSKFYADDLAAIKAAAGRKSVAELRESLARMGAVAAVSQAEIRVHCQV